MVQKINFMYNLIAILYFKRLDIYKLHLQKNIFGHTFKNGRYFRFRYFLTEYFY